MCTHLRINQLAGGAVLLVFALFGLMLAPDASAQWLPDGVPVCTATGYQGSLVSSPDGLGGAVMVWQDQRGPGLAAIYVQRINADGYVQWTTDGIKVSGASDQQFTPYICGDGAGGCWVTWNDRDGGYGDIYLRHLDASGTTVWGPTTLRIGGPIADNSLPVCARDGLGGVIVAWVQEPYPPSGTYQVVAQRVSAAGVVAWTPGGELVGDDIGTGQELSIATNTTWSYGVYLGWTTSTGVGIAQWVDAHGAPRWSGIYGESVGLTTAGSRVRVCHRKRATSGAYIMYSWTGGLFGYNNIFVASVDSTQYTWWDESVDSDGTTDEVGLDYRVMDDGLNGVYCVWDRWDGATGNGVYAKAFESDGDVRWSRRQVSDDEIGSHSPDAVVEYGSWSILVTWIGDDGGTPRLKYSKVYRSTGGVTSDVLVPGGYSSYWPTIVSEPDASTRPVIAWMDERDSDTDIYASGLDYTGEPTHPNLAVTSLTPESEPGVAGSGQNSFFVMIKNLGSSTSGSYWTTIYPDQATPPSAGDPPPPEVTSVLCPPLAPYDSLLVEIEIEAPASGETWSMWAFADYLDDVEEFDDEDDNIYGPRSYEWLSLPNLEITQFTLADSDPALGDTVYATIQIKNTGTAAAGSFDIDFYFDLASPPTPGMAGDQTASPSNLPANHTITFTSTFFLTNTTDLETWKCYAQVDGQETVTESNESDNVAGPRSCKWDPPEHEGWPVSGGAGFYSSPAIAELDDNPNTKEVVVGCLDGYLYAWDRDGNDLPGWPVNVGDSLYSSPAVGDITGDFHMEVVIGDQHGFLHAYDYQGTKLWALNVGAGYPANNTPVLEDLDGDDQLEVIFSVGASSGGGYVDVLYGDGSQYPLLTDMDLAGPGVTSPAVGDVDDDGDMEIAVVSYGVTKPAAGSLVYLFTDIGTNYNLNWPVFVDTAIIAPPVLGDATSAGTGPLEVITGGLNGVVYVMNLNGAVWPSPPDVGGPIETSPALVQYDADSYHEILVSTRRFVSGPPFSYWQGAVAAIDDDGSFLSKWPHSTSTWLFGAALPSPVVTGNRILVGNPGRDINGWINKSGVEPPELPIDVESPMEASLAVGDVDGDGFYDVVAVTTGGSVHCYDMSTAYDYVTTLDLQWPMFRNGRTRTGCYMQRVPTAIEDQTDSGVPAVTALKSIFPNPFNPATTVSFDLKQRAHVTVAVYDVAGRRVATLEDGFMEAGSWRATWNGMTDSGGMASSGVYFCRLVAGNAVDIRKMVLLK